MSTQTRREDELGERLGSHLQQESEAGEKGYESHGGAGTAMPLL